MDNSKPTEGTGGVLKMLASRLGKEVQNLASAAAERAVSSATDKISKSAERLTQRAVQAGGETLKSALGGDKGGLAGSLVSHGIDKVKEKLPGGGGGEKGDGQGKGKQLKVTNIVEQLDIGAPVRLCYDQWTQFQDFPTFMKKVENVKQESEEKTTWRAQILWSHRMWEATTVEQVPDQRIVWTSKGQKGHVDGSVTFHELAPELTRMVVVLQYYPKGFFEQTGNLWRAQGRRARLELKHFARHVMNHTVLHPEEVQGWRGEIHDGEVVQPQEGQQQEGQQQEGQQQEGQQQEGEKQQGRKEEGDEKQRAAKPGGEKSDSEKSSSEKEPAAAGSRS